METGVRGLRFGLWVGLCLVGAGVGRAGAQEAAQPMAVVEDAAVVGGLPDAPEPSVESTARAAEESARVEMRSADLVGVGLDPGGMSVRVPAERQFVALKDCPTTKIKAPECGVHWGELAISSSIFLTFQNIGNAYTGFYYRYETTHGKWWDRYVNSVTGYKYSVWSDGNPFLDDYVAHPMMGGITNALWIQNDPKSMTVTLHNDRAYWRSRLRALAFSAAYSTQWKLGPAGESGVGHAGDHLAYDNDRLRNETGFVSLVTTPVGGLVWTVAEDAMDRFVSTRLENKSHHWLALTGISFLTPTKPTGNILRFRPLWYRDSRVVKANSFWSDEDEGSAGLTAEGPGGKLTPEMKRANRLRRDAVNREAFIGRVPPVDVNLPGGKHELGVWWGMSLHSGHIFGFEKDVKWMPINVRYSYRLLLHENWALRYSPEAMALGLIDEVNWAPVDRETLRRRTYGSGVSPVGFQLDFLPSSRVQPFFSENSGLAYFTDKVFSPQGSQLLFSTDLGLGVNVFRKRRQAVTLGYRYQHLSNANVSDKNPGTDANTFYVGVSRFRTKGVL